MDLTKQRVKRYERKEEPKEEPVALDSVELWEPGEFQLRAICAEIMEEPVDPEPELEEIHLDALGAWCAIWILSIMGASVLARTAASGALGDRADSLRLAFPVLFGLVTAPVFGPQVAAELLLAMDPIQTWWFGVGAGMASGSIEPHVDQLINKVLRKGDQ